MNTFKHKLAVLVCTVPERREMFNDLAKHLLAGNEAGVLLASNNDTAPSIGAKRSAMLSYAQKEGAEYVVFVDDDDWVSPGYVGEILKTLNANPGVDCLSLHGIMYNEYQTNGLKGTDRTEAWEWEKPFIHDISYTQWEDRDDVFIRCPNHWNVVRTELAVLAGFPDKSWGEDHDYSINLRPLLKTQARLENATYYYRKCHNASAAWARMLRDGR